MPERLQKVLARAGIGSRRACEELIRAGRVRVAGETASIGMLVDPVRQDIYVDGKRITPGSKSYYFLVYKPKGYVSTVRDPQGRPKVTDLVPLPRQEAGAASTRGRHGAARRLFPVGRLDLHTSGLLLLTNDGELAFLLTHPRHDIWKTYLALVEGVPSAGDLATLRQGVMLPEGKTAPAKVKMARELTGGALLEISLREGKKRQVRRMCEAVGHPVIELKRTGLAFLTLRGLRPGQYRQLTSEEVRSLKEIALSCKEKSDRGRIEQ